MKELSELSEMRQLSGAEMMRYGMGVPIACLIILSTPGQSVQLWPFFSS